MRIFTLFRNVVIDTKFFAEFAASSISYLTNRIFLLNVKCKWMFTNECHSMKYWLEKLLMKFWQKNLSSNISKWKILKLMNRNMKPSTEFQDNACYTMRRGESNNGNVSSNLSLQNLTKIQWATCGHQRQRSSRQSGWK